MLHKEFEDKIISEIVNILGYYNSYKKYNLNMTNTKSKHAVSDEAKNITPAEYIPCMKSIYKKLSSMLYSHH
jgi:hypothetical protein